MKFADLKSEILKCRDCKSKFGFEPIPIMFGCSSSKIFQISQAPSRNVHITKKPFDDATGKKLKYEWYKIEDEAFYNEDEIEEVEGKKISISSKSTVEWIEEESYFFRLFKFSRRGPEGMQRLFPIQACVLKQTKAIS